MKKYYVYIMATKKGGTLYVGVTNDIIRRTYQHKNDIIKGFTNKYKVHLLVYYEIFDDPYNAIVREKQLKHWERQWKINLVESMNPEWKDLYYELI